MDELMRMTTEQHINEVIEALREAWKASPDQRLGQLIINAANPGDPCPSLFYIEDADLLNALKATNERNPRLS